MVQNREEQPGDLSLRLIRQTPLVVIVFWSPEEALADARSQAVKLSQSRKAAVKLMQRLPSHAPLPCRLTTPGMFLVSSSSILCKIPFWLRKPTMILGTPSKNDCIQNFNSLRSYLSMSLSFAIAAEVFNSTQLMGSSLFSGLQSHTEQL